MTSPDTVVFVSLGSNIEPEKNLAAAVGMLRAKCPILAVSAQYRTAPQGFTEQADFINMAVKLTTDLQPLAFKQQVLDAIEKALKRVRDPSNRNAPRTIDLDIALWNDQVFDYGHKPWHVPDKDITRFAHVAIPLAEIAPDYVHPETGQTLRQIAAEFDSTGVVRLS